MKTRHDSALLRNLEAQKEVHITRVRNIFAGITLVDLHETRCGILVKRTQDLEMIYSDISSSLSFGKIVVAYNFSSERVR